MPKNNQKNLKIDNPPSKELHYAEVTFESNSQKKLAKNHQPVIYSNINPTPNVSFNEKEMQAYKELVEKNYSLVEKNYSLVVTANQRLFAIDEKDGFGELLGEDIFLVENDQKKSELRQYTNAEKTESHLLTDDVQLDKDGSIIVDLSTYHTIKDKIIGYTLVITPNHRLFAIDEKEVFGEILGEDIFLAENDQKKIELRQYTNANKDSHLLIEVVELNKDRSTTKVGPSTYHTIKDKIIGYTLELTGDQKLFEIDEKNNFKEILGEDIFLVENNQKKIELRQYTNAEKTESHLLIDDVQLNKDRSTKVGPSTFHTIKDKIIGYTLLLTYNQKLFEIDEKNNFVKVLGEDIFLVKNDQKTELRQYTNEEKTESRLLTEGVHLNEYRLTNVSPSIYLKINKSLNLNSITKETLSAKLKKIFQSKPVPKQTPKKECLPNIGQR